MSAPSGRASPAALSRDAPWDIFCLAETNPGALTARVHIPPNARLDLWNTAANNQMLTILPRLRNGATLPLGAYGMYSGDTQSFDGRVFSEITVTAPSSMGGAIGALVPLDSAPVFHATELRKQPIAPNGTTSALPVVLIDDQGGVYQPYLGGAIVAPCDGVWHVALKATTAGTAPTINANAVFVGVIATDIVAGTVYPVAYPVKRGTAYAVGGATVVNGWIGPA